MFDRMRTLMIPLVAAATWFSSTAYGQVDAAYPKQAITFVVPYAAGGSSDTRARQLAQRMSADLGVPVVVDNRPGASGNIGTASVAKAKPDGYTIGLGNFAPMAVNAALYSGSLSYSPSKDLIPIALVERGAVVLATHARSSLVSARDLLGAKSGKALNYGSTGAGSASHLSTELLKQLAQIDAVHVPYRGGAPALNDLMAGNIDFYMELPSLFMGYMAGSQARIRPLAVAAPSRLKALPDTPTFAEIGLPHMVAYNWFGVVAPAGTPEPIVSRLNAAINKAMKDPAYREVVESQGAEVGGGTPGEFGAFIRAETDKWGKLIRDRGITQN